MQIKSKLKDYSVEFVEDIFNARTTLEQLGYTKLYFFIDGNVYRKYQEDISRYIGSDQYLIIDAIETNKEYTALTKYYQTLIEAGFTRRDCLVTIGGGILQDISGFIASTLYRGIPWVFIPTTLLAQADSCIGSKTSINFGDTKNLIGSFYPPDHIFIDVNFCSTLTDEYFNSGLGEIIKYHLMMDQEKYEMLKRYLNSGDLRSRKNLDPILQSSLEVKRTYFEEDEFDTGRRNLLNYGHCFGHALESASNFAVSHGEAVIVGMGFANMVSQKRGLLSEKQYDEFETVFASHYPRFNLSAIPADLLLTYLKRDKKRVGSDLTMILSSGLGQQKKYDDLKEEEFRGVYNQFCAIYPRS